jgi:hypothetical protein
MQIRDRLEGEAARGAYGIADGDGNRTKHNQTIFPIVHHDDDGRIRLLGTGFFITVSGIFVTARHVLAHVFKDEKKVFSPSLIHFRPDRSFLIRPILRFCSLEKSDVAVGVAAPMKHKVDGSMLMNQVLTLDSNIPERGTRIVTYAYPKNSNELVEGKQNITFEPRYYDGRLEEYLPDGRDGVMLPSSCYRTSIIIHSGASGGPVFSPNGYVFGVNSTGYDGTDISYVSSIRDIFDLSIDDVQIDDGPVQSITIRELSRIGQVIVNPKIA